MQALRAFHSNSITSSIQSGTTITLLTAGTIASAALAYYQPMRALQATTAILLSNLVTLPNLVRFGNGEQTRVILATHLAALGALVLGSSFIMIGGITQNFKNSLFTLLLKSFFITAVGGYMIPSGWQLLEKAHSLFNHDYWKRHFADLQAYYGARTEFGELDCKLKNSFWLLLSSLINLSRINKMPNSFQGNVFSASLLSPSLINLKESIKEFKDLPLPYPPQLKQKLSLQLKNSLDDMNSLEAKEAAELIFQSVPLLLDGKVTREEFVDLFNGPLLKEANDQIDQLLEKLRTLPSLDQLENVEREQCRKDIDACYKEAKKWQNVFQRWPNESFHLLERFSQIERLKQTLQADTLERLYHHIYALPNPQENPWSILAFHGFSMQDFENLCHCLKLFSIGHLNEKMRAAGLHTRQDFYEKQILTPNQIVTPEVIKERLEAYLNAKHLKPETLSQKVAGLFFRLAVTGLILVPVAVNPKEAGMGVGIGIAYCILKRFRNFNDTVNFDDYSALSMLVNLVKNRKIFSLTPLLKKYRGSFVEGNIFTKMRKINIEIGTAFIITYCHSIALGSFIRGFCIAHEIDQLIN